MSMPEMSIEDLILEEIGRRMESLIAKEDREYEEILVNGTGATPRMGIIDALPRRGVPTDR